MDVENKAENYKNNNSEEGQDDVVTSSLQTEVRQGTKKQRALAADVAA